MGRNKSYTDDELISITREYFETESHGDPRKLKWSRLEAYAARLGKDIKEHIFRKNPAVQTYIASIKSATIPVDPETFLAPFVPIDKKMVWENFTSQAGLMKQLDSFDKTAKRYYEAATVEHGKVLTLTGEIAAQKCRIAELEAKIDSQENAVSVDSDEVARLKTENDLLRYVIKKYLRPEIARQLCAFDTSSEAESGVLNEDVFGEFTGKDVVSIASVRNKLDSIFQKTSGIPVEKTNTDTDTSTVSMPVMPVESYLPVDEQDELTKALHKLERMSDVKRRKLANALS